MTLQTKVRQWLGISEIQEHQGLINRRFRELRDELIAFQSLKREVAIHNRALARFIAKLDPMFAGDEMSPERKAESDKITEAVIKKLIGEHLASRVPGDHA